MYLTNPNPEFTRPVVRTPEGMMFWAGTCSDPKATCGGCKHYDHDINTRKHLGSCALYQRYTERLGKNFSSKTPACKYFENKQP